MATKLSWRTEQRRVKDLLPFKQNPRKMSPKQIVDLTKSLKKFNLVEIPAIDTDDKIIAGHQRIAVMQLLGRGEEMIDVRVPSRPLTESEYKEYLLTSNAVHGSWDYEMLAEYFDIDTLIESGLDDQDISRAFADTLEVDDDEFDVEKELKAIKKPRAKLGDIYQLGMHRVACGDSLKSENIKKLVGDAKIDMIYSDPIYNIGLDYNKGVGGKAKYGGTVGDSKSEKDYREFLNAAIKSALSVAKKDCHVFFWSDQRYVGMVQSLYEALGIQNKRTCLWIKGAANPVPMVAFNKSYEPCVYGIRGTPFISKAFLNFNEILNKETTGGNQLLEEVMGIFDLWLSKRVAGNKYEHATQKPVTLHEKSIKRCTKPGDTILDLFGGSGSTLIAAESMKRVCYMSEIEPIFVDLIIRRYEKLTGIKAKKIHGH